MVWWLAGSALKHTLIDRLFFNPSFSGVQGDVHVLLLSHVQLRPAEGQRLPEHVHQEGQVSWKSAEMMGCRRCPVGVSWRGFFLKPPWGNISTLPMPQVPAQYGHSSRRPPPADPQQRCCPCAARTARYMARCTGNAGQPAVMAVPRFCPIRSAAATTAMSWLTRASSWTLLPTRLSWPPVPVSAHKCSALPLQHGQQQRRCSVERPAPAHHMHCPLPAAPPPAADATCPARRSLLGVAQAKHWNRNPFRHFK